MKLKYNYNFLENYCNSNNIVLLKDYSKEHINICFTIDGICSNNNCNNTFSKTIKILLNNTLCSKCGAIKRLKKLEENNMQKYGVKNVFELKITKDKLKNTNLQKYGVENPSQSILIKKKKEVTIMKNFGVSCAFKSKDIQEKIKETNIKKYGFANVSQNPGISEKQNKGGYKLREYIFPGGTKINYQGYEHYALNMLLFEEKIKEDDIVMARTLVPTIWYYDSNNIKRRHFVDIYIKSQNKCIEVKSTWTYKKHYDKVIAKQEQAKKDGFLYEILVYDNKGLLINRYI